MKSNDDDQPLRKEKQGGSDKKQPSLTLAQIETAFSKAISKALKPIQDAFDALAGEHGNLKVEVDQVRGITDGTLALLQEDGPLMSALASAVKSSVQAAESTKDLPSELKHLRDQVALIPAIEDRLTAEVRGSSSKGEASAAQTEITAMMVEIAGQDRLDSTNRHSELVGRFDSVDQGIVEVRADINTSAQDLINRISGLSSGIGQIMREHRKLKRRAHEMRRLIGADGDLTRSNFGQAFSMQTDYLEEVIGASSESLVELLGLARREIADLPENMSKELVGVLSQLVGVAQKVLQGATSITQHMEGLSRSTELAFSTQGNLLKQMEVQASQAGIRMEQGVQDMLTRSSTALEKKVVATLESFDPEGYLADLRESYATMRLYMEQYAQLMDKAEGYTGKIDKAQAEVIDQSEKVVASIGKPLKDALDLLKLLGDRFATVQSGFQESSETGAALVNRIQRVSLEAFQSDVERVNEMAAKQQQKAADAILGAFTDLVEKKLPQMIEEGVSKVMSKLIEGVVLDDAEPTK